MNQDTIALLVYRLVVLLCGFGSIVMGYRLFRVGVFEKAGELKANWGGRSLLLKAAAPGTFFALFGSAIIAITVWKGFIIESSKPVGYAATGAQVGAGAQGEASEFQNALRAALEGRPLNETQKNAIAAGLGLVETHRGAAK